MKNKHKSNFDDAYRICREHRDELLFQFPEELLQFDNQSLGAAIHTLFESKTDDSFGYYPDRIYYQMLFKQIKNNYSSDFGIKNMIQNFRNLNEIFEESLKTLSKNIEKLVENIRKYP